MTLACRRCNTAKGNVFTHGEWAEIATKYLSPKVLAMRKKDEAQKREAATLSLHFNLKEVHS